ncbi:MAG: 16S rRNA (uracil(1498)-N(3))-methyltransferase [Bacteroidetes bacterium]|nr:16S rRNA (uracil(1498)-N(3))-methyltransferase [Bacteroidota bacterium]
MADQFYDPVIYPVQSGFRLSDEQHHHAIRVSRMVVGDRFWLADGRGTRSECVLTHASKKEAVAQVVSAAKVEPVWPCRLTVGIGLLKQPARLDWVIEKLTEMQVHRIVAIESSRTVKGNFRADRWEKLAVSAMNQSLGSWLPIIGFSHFEELPSLTGSNPSAWIAHEKRLESSENIRKVPVSEPEDIFVFFGPEGGWSEADLAFGTSNGWRALYLGPTRLRTETAVLVACSALFQQTIP